MKTGNLRDRFEPLGSRKEARSMKVKEILAQMSLEEKAGLCSGKDMWRTKALERLKTPAITVSDGPHGLRKQQEGGDNLGLADSVPATCFPTAGALAASWDRSLLAEVGAAIARECLQEKVSVLLAPGVNIKRSPLCGRNFEYYSEDPFLAGELAAAFIEGVQSQGVGTSLKHFAANNQEHLRMTVDAVVDERALREIYLPAFEKAVKKAKPWTVMAAYNKLNGTYCSEHRQLLTEILKEEWGHEGLVVTDWGACNDRAEGLQAGQELEMPGGGLDNDRSIVEGVKSGSLDIAVLDAAVERILGLIEKSARNMQEDYRCDLEAHHDLARYASARSAVLLKNEDSILPLKPPGRLGVIGELAANPRYQGSGSSLINPTRVDTALEHLKGQGLEFRFAPGYDLKRNNPDEELMGEALKIAAESGTIAFFAGLPDTYESEGFDREHMRLPHNQNILIERIAKVNANIVVVLWGGAPVEMPWVNQVKGILNMYLPGQGGGRAAADLLLGKTNPSGKLAETYPRRLRDCLSSAYFPEGPRTVEYRESIFVGYRYFDTAGKEVLFPFGHGLSYTRFAYSDMILSRAGVNDFGQLKVSVKVKNTGEIPGAEIVQLYIQPPPSKIFKAARELKGFARVALNPGEEKRVEFMLDERSFAYYNAVVGGWHIENGPYKILIGASSRDIRLRERVIVDLPGEEGEVPDYRRTAPYYYHLPGEDMQIPGEQFAAVYGRPLPDKGAVQGGFTRNSTLGDIKDTFPGKILYREIYKRAIPETVGEDKDSRREVTKNMLEKMLPQLPLRSVATSSGGMLTLGMVDGLILILNGRRVKGLLKVFRSLPGKQLGK